MPATTETIWADFHQQLLAFIRRRVSDPDTAQDLLQDVFVKIHLKLPSLTQADKLASWVYQITRHTLLDHAKRRRLTTTPGQEPPDLAAAEEPPTYNADFAACLQPFLARLSEPYHEALKHTELGLLSQKDYAVQAGLSHSGAKSRVQRAKKQLHALFTACCHVSADIYGNVLALQPKSACGCVFLEDDRL